jgi:hypothetical protein
MTVSAITQDNGIAGAFSVVVALIVICKEVSIIAGSTFGFEFTGIGVATVTRIVAFLAGVHMAVAAIVGRAHAFSVVVALAVGRAGTRFSFTRKLAGITASVVVVACLSVLHLSVTAFRGIFRNDHEPFFPVFMMIVITLVAEDFFD